MTGLWNRIIPGEDRCPAHLLKAAMHLAVFGVFTDEQLRTGLESRMTTPFDAAAISDLGAIRAAIAAMATQGRLVALERFDAMNIAAECGVLTSEVTYRTQLGI